MEGEMRQVHVMMVPWLSKSHITAFLELANKLSAHGLKISFLSTPLNIRWISQQLQFLPFGEIDLLELPLPFVDGLPAGVESTADLKRGGTFELLIKAMDEWEKPFEVLLTRVSPDLVIHDMTQYWASPIAAKLGIPAIFFSNTSPASSGFLVGHEAAMIAEKGIAVTDLTVPPPGFPSDHIRHSPFEARTNLHVFIKKEGQISMAERWNMCFQGSWIVAYNTCRELEGKYLEYIERTTGRPVLPVGLQMPDLMPPPAGDRCLAWLHLQKPRSVVVVSLGSECILTKQDLAALALGLEDSEVPFLFILLHQMAAELPKGFVDRTQGRGLLVTEWAPQVHILAHSSAGAFLSHCGWTSVSEGLRFGVPFVGLPLQHDQGLNAKLVAHELKLGVEITRNEEDGSFSKEDVSKAVRTLMVEEEGRQIRSRVQEADGVLTRNNCEIYRSNIQNFVSLIIQKALCGCKLEFH